MTTPDRLNNRAAVWGLILTVLALSTLTFVSIAAWTLEWRWLVPGAATAVTYWRCVLVARRLYREGWFTK